MLKPEIFLVADTATAVMLALGFLTAYLVDRKLAAFRWWAICYALLAITIGMTSARVVTPNAWIEILAGISLYGAVSIVAYGMYKEHESRTRPHLSIAVGAAGLAVIVAALGIANAAPEVWVLGSIAPTVAFALWSIGAVLREKPRKPFELGYAAALFGGTLLICVRTSWFANLLSGPGHLVPFFNGSMYQSLILSFATILAMVVLAMALIFRVSLAAVSRMRERSTTDAMTGLLNRATFDDRAAELLDAGNGRPICAVVFDIDRFKRINDTFGHPTGDRVIARIGEILRDAVAGNQIAGRIGGEEFAVILPGSTLGAARLFAEAVRTRFSASDFDGDIPWTVTLSAGVAIREDDEPLHALVARADKALYAAKNGGRNRVVVRSFDELDDIGIVRA